MSWDNLSKQQQAHDHTRNLVQVLKAHAPRATDGTPHHEFGDYCRTLTAQATLRWRSLQSAAAEHQRARDAA